MGRSRLAAGASVFGAVAVGGLTVGGYGAGVGLHTFRLRRVTVPVLPLGSPRLRVLHISDLHLLARQARKRAFVHQLARLDPHVVVNTGDNIASADALPALLDTLEPLLARPGSFVFGSNDFQAPTPRNPFHYLLPESLKRERRHVDNLPTAEVRAAFTDAGWLDLNNAGGTLTARGPDLGPSGSVEVAVTGTGDAHIDRDDLSTIDGAPADRPALAVTHAPYRRVLDAFTNHDWPLILAGHTHGGQLCLPGHRAIISNSDLPPDQASGLSRWPLDATATAYLHVSAGLGTSPWAPVRINCPPEATLLTLVPADSS